MRCLDYNIYAYACYIIDYIARIIMAATAGLARPVATWGGEGNSMLWYCT